MAKDDKPIPVELKSLGDSMFELELTNGRTAVIKQLNGFEQLVADDYCGSTESGARTVRTYGICMLQKINGLGVAPLSNPLEFENVALTSQDTLFLMKAYNQLENPEEGLALKNASSVAGELK